MSRVKIEDGLSKQQRYQLRKKEQGLCIRCGINPSEQSYCQKCIEKSTNRKNYNKNINLKKLKEKIIENIEIEVKYYYTLSKNKDKIKMNKIYDKVKEKMKLKVSNATLRTYWLQHKNK